MRRAARVVGALAAAAAVGAGAWLLLRGQPLPARTVGAPAGRIAGRAVAAGALADPLLWRAPRRCLAEAQPLPAPLVLVPGDGPARLGVVADARGAGEGTLAAIGRAREAFARARVDAVVALGGLGGTRAELATVLGALAGAAPALVAVPGDREPLEDFRAALEALAGRGLTVVDGSRTPLVRVRGATLALLAGVPLGWNALVAGPDGCARADADADALAAALLAAPGARVLASPLPPRQSGLGATDLALGGVHVGDPAVSRAADRAGARVVLHAFVDETGGRTAPLGAATAISVGPLEPGASRHDGTLARGGGAIVVVDEKGAEVIPF